MTPRQVTQCVILIVAILLIAYDILWTWRYGWQASRQCCAIGRTAGRFLSSQSALSPDTFSGRYGHANDYPLAVANNDFSPSAKIRGAKKRAVLKHYARCGTVYRACDAAGIHHKTWYDWKRKDPEFLAAVEEALEHYIERLEAEADRRAIEGTKVLKFGKDGAHIDPRTGEVYEESSYSDTLLIFRLKALRPEVYRERYEVKRSDAELDKEIESQLESLAARRSAITANGESNGKPE